MSFDFGMRPPRSPHSHLAAASEPEEYDVDEEEADPEFSDSADLQAAKERSGLGDRDDIKTWVDLHDAEEGRKPLATLVH